MSDARPSGPQTAVCHNNHRRMTWTRRDKTTMEQEKTKGKRLTEIKVREQKRVLAREIFSLRPKAYFNLSRSSFHTAGAQTLSVFVFFSHFPLPLFFFSVLVLSHLFTADLPCFQALRCSGHAQSGENRHLQSFFPVSLAPLCWKIERNRHQNRSVLSPFSFYARWKLLLKVFL